MELAHEPQNCKITFKNNGTTMNIEIDLRKDLGMSGTAKSYIIAKCGVPKFYEAPHPDITRKIIISMKVVEEKWLHEEYLRREGRM